MDEKLEQKNKAAQEQQALTVRNQTHATLKAKYSNYDPVEIDTVTSDFITGKIQATQEHIYKIVKYEENMGRSYKIGVEDGRKGVSVPPVSLDGLSVREADPGLIPEKGETDKNFVMRLMSDIASKIHK